MTATTKTAAGSGRAAPELPLTGEVTTPGTAVAPAATPPVAAVPARTDANASVTRLLEQAVEKGTPVEQLKELVDLHERMTAREAAQQFIRALAAFKSELPPIVHTKKVSFTTRTGSKTNYSYTELDELARHIDPGLTKHGFTYSWDQALVDGMVTTRCTLFHEAGHSRTSSFTLPATNDSAASPQQKIGMADTYASRRSLISVLGLTTADTDPGAAEIDPTPISEEELIQIEDMVTETQANLPRFLKFLQVSALKDLPAARFKEAVAALREIGAQREQKKQGRAAK